MPSSSPSDRQPLSPAHAEQSPHGPRVLVVDDNPAMLRSLERVVGITCDLVTAVDGLDALRKVKELGPFPVVMTDQRMPHMCGVELINELETVAPTTECLLLTGNANDPEVRELVESGRLFRLLLKPCSVAEILSAIQAADHAFRAWNPVVSMPS